MTTARPTHRWRLAAAPVIAVALGLLTTTPAAAADDPLAGAPGAGDPYYPFDGNGGYDATHYDVAIDYNPASHHLIGKATITATATQFLHSFNLDFEGPPVSEITVNGLPASFLHHGEHELTIVPALPVLPGLPFSVVVDYAGRQPDLRGRGWTYAPSGGAFAVGQPHSAATWYPLNDTPRDKATFTVHATVPSRWDVVSNGIETQNTVTGPNRTVTWSTRNPVAGYLTTIAIDHFSYLNQRRADGTPLFSAFAPGTGSHKAVEARLPQILDFVEQLYGPYPLESGGGIYVDTKLEFSLETQTRPIYAPWTDLATVVHENAHQWWGDSMSVYSWADVCLNECFASYTAELLWPERMEHKNPDKAYRATVATDGADPKFWEIPLYNPGPRHEFTSVYTRGPLFLHALRRTMGDPAFFAAVRDFVQGHRNGNASIPEFRQFMQSRTPVGLTAFFDAWLNQAAKPAAEFLYPGSLRS